MSAAWLRLMGHQDVFVSDGALQGGTARPAAPELGAAVSTIDVAGLAAILAETAVIDLARSVDFRDGHIPGAIWGVRSRLAALPTGKPVVIASPDGKAALLAVPEVRTLTGQEPRVLAGGTAAWKAAGQPLEKNRLIPADEDCIDFYLRPYDRNSGIEDAMNAYLSWEIDLVHEIDRDGTVKFGAGH
jgi:rhodanese-related sulfurtransferase